MEGELVVQPDEIEAVQRPLTAVEIKAQVNLIQEVMAAVMKKDLHYGVIPGCAKPSLWKPGAEKILATFHIAPDPIVEDLSMVDEARFRVICRAISDKGRFLGAGVGECSSNEEKYRWRKAVCTEEWDETPKNRQREKWAKGKGGSTYRIKQVRVNPADVSNTILKMAKKRALVDLCLTATACSDIFDQDIEDLPTHMQEDIARATQEAPPPVKPPARKSAATPPKQPAKGAAISQAQVTRLFAIAKELGWINDEVKLLIQRHGYESTKDILKADYEAIIAEIQGVGGQPEPGASG